MDGSPVAEIALPYARALAQELNLPVTLLSAIDLEEIARHIAIERGLFLDTLDDFETRRRLFRSYNVPYASYYEGGGSYAVDLPQLSAAIETDVQHYLEARCAAFTKAGLVKVSSASQEGLPGTRLFIMRAPSLTV